jgi:hypothetical protein
MLTHPPASRDPFTRDDFVAICAETGTTANCCDFTFVRIFPTAQCFWSQTII